MARYLAQQVAGDKSKLGLGYRSFYFEYASIANLIKFGLSKDGVPPGQYDIYLAPLGDANPKLRERVATAYKRV